MVSSLSVYYRKLAYHVIESDGFLWVGFKPGMVHFIAKEVWNIRPLTRTDVERYYEEFTVLTQGKGSLYFRIVAHGGFLKEALAYELHGLTVSDDNYLRSLNSGRHVELYPHNEKAYRAIIKGFEQHRIGTVIASDRDGKVISAGSLYIRPCHRTNLRICSKCHNPGGDQKAVGFTSPYICYRTFQSLIYYRKMINNSKQIIF